MFGFIFRTCVTVAVVVSCGTVVVMVPCASAIVLFHVFVFMAQSVGLTYDVFYMDLGTGGGYSSLLTHDGYGGKFKYITFWGQVRM